VRRDGWERPEVRREDGESGVEATVGGKDSAGREVGEKVMGIVVEAKVLRHSQTYRQYPRTRGSKA
jgi:hypothetical protein